MFSSPVYQTLAVELRIVIGRKGEPRRRKTRRIGNIRRGLSLDILKTRASRPIAGVRLLRGGAKSLRKICRNSE
jgi:hypothetical protein